MTSWRATSRTGISLLLLVALAGCSGLGAPREMERYFDTVEPLSERVERLPVIDKAPPPVGLVASQCAAGPCYAVAGPDVETPDAYAYSPEAMSAVLTALKKGEEAVVAGNHYAATIEARERELNATNRIGRLTEAQVAMAEQQAKFYHSQYRYEWWTSRLAAILLLLKGGL